MLLDGEPLHLHGRTLRGQGAPIAGEDLMGPQTAEVVLSYQEREVGEALHERLVVLPVLHHQPRDPQEERCIGLLPDGDPVIGLGGRRAVLGRDHHDLAPPLHALDEPVGVGQLVLHQVLPVHDDELRRAQVVEVAVGGLDSVHPGMARRLVSVPGVVGPGSPGPCLLAGDAADLDIQQGEGVAQAVHAVLPQDTEQTHTAAHLDAAGAGASCGLHHLRLLTLGEKPAAPLLAAVAACDGIQGPGDQREGLIPRGLDELVLTPPVEQEP